ncbi:MAG: restriction endonuclease subunit S [Mycoplasmataceae bacterium]|nr:restriction endonuclease subunit S [Mycoplasmataceae bacterium]
MHKLVDICCLEKGKTGIQKAVAGDYPLVVTAEERLSCNEYQFDCEACCIPLVSSSGHGHASLKRVHYQSGKFALGNILCAVIPKDKKFVLAEYLYVYFSVFKDDLLVPLMKGAANVSMTVNSLKNVEVYVPSIDQQKEIIKKYNTILDCIKEISSINSNSDEIIRKLKKEILDEAIKGNINNLERNNCDGDFPIPDDWRWETVRNLCDYQNGYAFSKADYSKEKNGVPVIKSNNIMKLIVEINEKTDFVESPNKKMLNCAIKKGDLLMCLSSQSPNPEPLAKTALYDFDTIALLNQRVLKLTPKDENYTRYLYYALNSEYYHYNVTKKAGGSGQANLKLEHVLDFAIPIPPKEIVKEVVEKIDYLYKKVNEIEKYNIENKRNTDLILKVFLKQFILKKEQ